jgi:hypothetical protein
MARIQQAYQELKKLVKAKKTLDVVLGLETFTSMAITSFVIDREAETGANLPFTMEFKKLKIVHSDTTKINTSGSEAGGAGDQTSSTANMGVAGTQQPDNSAAKEEWRFQIEHGGPATPATYLREFGVPYPQ